MGNCQRRLSKQVSSDDSALNLPPSTRCSRHKLLATFTCIDAKCKATTKTPLCTRCLTNEHSQHECKEISDLDEDVEGEGESSQAQTQEVSEVSQQIIESQLFRLNKLAIDIKHQHAMRRHPSVSRVLLEGATLKKPSPPIFTTIDESILLKLQQAAKSLASRQDQLQFSEEEHMLQMVEYLLRPPLSSPSPIPTSVQKDLITFQKSPTLDEFQEYLSFKAAQSVTASAHAYSPYKFNFSSFANRHESTLEVQLKDYTAESMKLRMCCRMNARYTAVHFRDSKKHSQVLIIDLLEEQVVYAYSHTPPVAVVDIGQHNTPPYLYKISSLGKLCLCFNFITEIIIVDFSTLVGSTSTRLWKSTKRSPTKLSPPPRTSFINQAITSISNLAGLSSTHQSGNNSQSPLHPPYTMHQEKFTTELPPKRSVKIKSKKLIYCVDMLRSGKLCLIEEQDFDIGFQNFAYREYSVWDFKRKQCIRKLDVEQPQSVLYDILGNYLVLDSTSGDSFSLFDWQMNRQVKVYSEVDKYLKHHADKALGQSQVYNVQAVKVFAIQKLLTTKNDTFLSSHVAFEEWLVSLPFQYKQMIIFEDSWLFKYDRTAIIMIADHLLVYDMNLNQVVQKLPLKLPEENISFIWQATNKLIFITKDGDFHFFT